MGYCCAEAKSKVNLYHEQWVELSLPHRHFKTKGVRKGVKGALVEAEDHIRIVSRSLMSKIFGGMEDNFGG